MRRRRRDLQLEVPEHLLYFRPEDWAIDRGEATTLWLAARHEWLRAHREEVDAVWFIGQGYRERRGEPWVDLDYYDPSMGWSSPNRRRRRG